MSNRKWYAAHIGKLPGESDWEEYVVNITNDEMKIVLKRIMNDYNKTIRDNFPEDDYSNFFDEMFDNINSLISQAETPIDPMEKFLEMVEKLDVDFLIQRMGDGDDFECMLRFDFYYCLTVPLELIQYLRWEDSDEFVITTTETPEGLQMFGMDKSTGDFHVTVDINDFEGEIPFALDINNDEVSVNVAETIRRLTYYQITGIPDYVADSYIHGLGKVLRLSDDDDLRDKFPTLQKAWDNVRDDWRESIQQNKIVGNVIKGMDYYQTTKHLMK